MPKKQRSIGRILVATLVVVLLSAVTFFAYQLKQTRINSPLLGTWKGDNGRVVNFRADGTARYRGSANGKANQILYFEWKVDSSNNLVRWNEGSSQVPWQHRLRQRLFGSDGRQLPMKIVEATKAGFTLHSDGIETVYVPTQDTQMESAP